MTGLRRVGGAFTTGVLVIVVGALALIVGAQVVGYQTMVVRSGSMGGAIPVGSLVLTELVPSQAIEVGDVAVVDPEGPAEPRLHRVIEVERRGDTTSVVTQGDANPTPDRGQTVLPASVPAPALVLPWVGYVMTAAGSRSGLLALATGVTIVAGWWLLQSLWSPAPRRDATEPAGSVRA